MKRLSSIFLAVLFVIGVLIIPAIHQAYCTDEHAAHDAGHCLFCQTAHTPFRLSAVILAPVDTVCMVDTLIPAAPIIPQFYLRTATQARAPPVA